MESRFEGSSQRYQKPLDVLGRILISLLVVKLNVRRGDCELPTQPHKRWLGRYFLKSDNTVLASRAVNTAHGNVCLEYSALCLVCCCQPHLQPLVPCKPSNGPTRVQKGPARPGPSPTKVEPSPTQPKKRKPGLAQWAQWAGPYKKRN